MNEEQAQQFGELIGAVRAIKENTDKLPELATLVAVHENRINELAPQVKEHEKTTQRAFGIAAVVGILSGLVAGLIRIGHG